MDEAPKDGGKKRGIERNNCNLAWYFSMNQADHPSAVQLVTGAARTRTLFDNGLSGLPGPFETVIAVF
jgi:hypothetical protein